MPDIWTIQAALGWTVGYLERHDDEHPRLSAEWLISEATGLSRIELYAYFDRPLTQEERNVLREGVRRRGTGEPLQYVSGEVAFRHIVIKTRKGVLIPRPETELLVQEGLDFLAGLPGVTPLVLDLCTGSGCIALSLARENPDVHVIATDIDPAAASLARDNARALGLDGRVEVLECDLAEAVPADLIGTLDLIISNPPYIPTAELAGLPREVAAWESRLALDGGDDGLDVFRRIAAFAHGALVPSGMLACELHETKLEEAKALCGSFASVRIAPDFTGRPRILVAYR